MASHLTTGEYGEELAARYLAEHGYTVVERRARSGRGDIDLVCRHKREWIFVEVKTRHASPFGTAVDSLTRAKITNLSKSIALYVHAHNLHHAAIRCDVVTVDIDADGNADVRHLPAAFMPVGVV